MGGCAFTKPATNNLNVVQNAQFSCSIKCLPAFFMHGNQKRKGKTKQTKACKNCINFLFLAIQVFGKLISAICNRKYCTPCKWTQFGQKGMHTNNKYGKLTDLQSYFAQKSKFEMS